MTTGEENAAGERERRDEIERGPLRFLFTAVPNRRRDDRSAEGREQRWRVINGRDSI